MYTLVCRLYRWNRGWLRYGEPEQGFWGSSTDPVRYFAQGHTTAAMYLGHVVEIGPTEGVVGRPMHPYTQVLIAALPVPNPTSQLQGEG